MLDRSGFYDRDAVSSLVEVIAGLTGAPTLVASTYLHLWLPDLVTPPGWADNVLDGAAVTRMLVRRLDGSSQWDSCEVLNLYSVRGTVSEALVLGNAGRTLRNGGAVGIEVHRVATPPNYEVIAARATGRLVTSGRTVCGQYTYYVVNTAVGSALIEQAILVGSDALATLARELEGLTKNVFRSLLASIDSVPRSAHPDAHPAADARQGTSDGRMENLNPSHVPASRQASEFHDRESL